MSININDNFKVNAPKPIDSRYGPWSSTAEAISNIVEAERYVGLTVGVDIGPTVVEYWWEDVVADSGLVSKQFGGDQTVDSLTLNGGVLADLGVGELGFNSEAGTLQVGLTENITMSVGQDLFFRVKNSTESTLHKGQPVYISGVLGNGEILQAAKFGVGGAVDDVRFI